MSASFRHPCVERLEESYGYNLQVLKLCAWIITTKEKDVNMNALNELFWKINNLRLEGNAKDLILDWIDKIDKIETDISKILREIGVKARTCYQCKINQVCILYLPCGHLILCSVCLKSDNKHCELCQEPIEETCSVYF